MRDLRVKISLISLSSLIDLRVKISRDGELLLETLTKRCSNINLYRVILLLLLNL